MTRCYENETVASRDLETLLWGERGAQLRSDQEWFSGADGHVDMCDAHAARC